MKRPALWMAAALAVGIAAAESLRPHPLLVLAAVAASAGWVALSQSASRVTIALLVTVACLGGLRYAYDQTAGRGNLGAWEGRKVSLVGTVTGEPELRKPRGVGYAVAVEQVEGHPATGSVYVTQWGGPAPGFGERVRLTGALKPPPGPRMPGAFDQAAYLARQAIYLTVETQGVERLGPGALNPVRRAAVAARLRLEKVLKATLPPSDAALMAGLVFGSRSELPDQVKEAFRASGVLHLLAVSGGNIAMVVVPLLLILRRLGLSRRGAAAVAIPGVLFFCLLTGATPSVMRAGIMAVLVLLGDLLRRERNALNTLGAAALLLLLWQPGLVFDVGFQLSAGATLGILLFARPIERRLSRWCGGIFGPRAGGWLAAGLSVTFAAQILVEPISLYNFGTTSLIAPVANLLVLSFLEYVVQVGSVAALAGLLWTAAAWFLMWPVRLGLWLLLFTVRATAAVPGAYLQVGRLPLVWVALWYCTVAALAVPALRRALAAGAQRVREHWAASPAPARRLEAALLALLLITGLTWRAALADPPDTLAVTFLDVGQGDAILVRAPGGHAMLIDAGVAAPPDPARGLAGYDMGADVVLPHLADLGVRRLDQLVLTHPDGDHAGGGAAVLRGVPVGTLLFSGDNPGERGYTAALREAAARGVPTRRPVRGEQIALSPEVTLEVLNPPAESYAGTRSDDNSNCIALRLQYRQVSMLFTCDLEAEVEEDLAASGLPVQANVLKVAHHGSGYSSSEAFLQAVRPQLAVISVGNGNSFGHPNRAALQRLEEVGASILRTDQQGTVVVRTDGLTLKAETARPAPAPVGSRPLGILGRRLLFAW